MPVSVDSLSRETIFCVVEGTQGGSRVDPSGYEVLWSFQAEGVKPDPDAPGDWVAGGWERSGQTWEATVIVGRGSDAELDPNPDDGYRIWVRWITPDEDVIKRGDLLRVT